MHEAGIMEDLLRSVREKAGNEKVRKIYLRLGRDSGVSGESLRLWFETLRRGTNLEAAVLEIAPEEGREIIVDSLEVE